MIYRTVIFSGTISLVLIRVLHNSYTSFRTIKFYNTHIQNAYISHHLRNNLSMH